MGTERIAARRGREEEEETHSTQDNHKSHSTGFIFHFYESILYGVQDCS